MTNSKDRIIPKELEELIRKSERPEAPFANKELARIVELKHKEYNKTFSELSKDIAEFHMDHLREISSISTTIEWHLEKMKKNNSGHMLYWEHTNKFEDNIKSTIELTIFIQHDLTIPNHYNINLVEWHYFYDDDIDGDLFSIDITIDNENIGIENHSVQNMDNFASFIFKYVYLGGKLEDFKKPPTYLY